jgi:predicted ester cyclase
MNPTTTGWLGSAATGALSQAKAVALRTFQVMESDDLADFEEVYHLEFLSHDANAAPPAARGRGPAAAHATAPWLRDAFAELRWEVHDVVAEGDLVVAHCTMSGRHVRDFVVYSEDGSAKDAFPPTGGRFAVAQSHWLRIADGQCIEHWATRDDLGMGEQLGWVPPSPAYLVRMALAKRRARRR